MKKRFDEYKFSKDYRRFIEDCHADEALKARTLARMRQGELGVWASVRPLPARRGQRWLPLAAALTLVLAALFLFSLQGAVDSGVGQIAEAAKMADATEAAVGGAEPSMSFPSQERALPAPTRAAAEEATEPLNCLASPSISLEKTEWTLDELRAHPYLNLYVATSGGESALRAETDYSLDFLGPSGEWQPLELRAASLIPKLTPDVSESAPDGENRSSDAPYPEIVDLTRLPEPLRPGRYRLNRWLDGQLCSVEFTLLP